MPYVIPNEVDAVFTDQAEPDSGDFDIILRGLHRTGVISGCAVTAQGSPDMTVAVAAGLVDSSGRRFTVTAGNVTVGAADGTNPRFDLIGVDSSGTKGITAGTAAANPVFPAIATDTVVLAAVYVPASDTDIDANQIIDKRVILNRFDRPGHPLRTTSWYGAQIGSGGVSSSGFTPVVDRLYFTPFYSWQRRTYDRIGVYVATLAAGANARLGIYEGNVDRVPIDLLLDAGEVSVATTGAKELTISTELAPRRLYWLAFVSDGTPALRNYNAAEGGNLFVGRKDSGSNSAAIRQVYGPHTYGTLPSTAPTLTWSDAVGAGQLNITLRLA